MQQHGPSVQQHPEAVHVNLSMSLGTDEPVCFFCMEEVENDQFSSSVGQVVDHSLSPCSTFLELCFTTL